MKSYVHSLPVVLAQQSILDGYSSSHSHPLPNSSISLLTTKIHYEQDVVLVRQRARQIALELGFDPQDQTRIATAVSEVARNAFQYAQGGKVEFRLSGQVPQSFEIQISDTGPGIADLTTILAGHYQSSTGMGLGLIGATRLMDGVKVETELGRGTSVLLHKQLPKPREFLSPEAISALLDELLQRSPQGALSEMQQQNQELLQALDALHQRQDELTQLNQELADTNRGVVALYAELNDKAESLQHVSELKTRFLSNIGHEFRTPLNAVHSLTQLLLSQLDGSLNTEQTKQVKFIQHSATSLSELVNDLLDLAKVEAGKIAVRSTEFEIVDLFRSLRGVLRPLLPQTPDVSLIFEDPVGIPALNTDEGKVAQILRNLIANALKYTEQGEVRVSARLEDKQTIRIAVADTGIGIASADQNRIFEEFVQIANPLQARVKGTGLGLSLSRKLAQLLGGNLTVQSQVGVGSTFSLTLPLNYAGEVDAIYEPQPQKRRLSRSEPTAIAASVPTPNPLSSLPASAVQWASDPLKILIIDDDPTFRYVLHQLLRPVSVDILEAQGGYEGLGRAWADLPHVILLDWLMPDLAGWNVLQQLKANPVTQAIPVIIVTSQSLDSIQTQQVTAMTVAILSKESNAQQLTIADLHAALLKAGLTLPAIAPEAP
jgi:signal transduction histidine kinase/ActR/RegA family two-component response regulator